NHREEEDQEGNNSSEIETLTYHVLATHGLDATSEIEPRARTSRDRAESTTEGGDGEATGSRHLNDDQIMTMVRQGKQRGHIPFVGRVLAGRGKDVLDVPVPQCNHTSDVFQLFTQLQSQHESGNVSGCRAGEDDESGDDEDAGEDADS
ncbi:hypothetical protein Tco_1396494, partial [Tanacetum coccineum]